MENPLISFVATSRNDDHGGDVLHRTQSFVNGLAKQASRHKVPVELVLVDWNPPEPRAPLMDVLDWPEGSELFGAKVVTVPRSLHASLRNSTQLAMFQMIAKNVGIRRAKGNYICATNIDIIFSDELFRWLGGGELSPGAVYRSDRWDMPNEIQLEEDFDCLLMRARDEAIRKNLIDGTYVRENGKFVAATQERIDWMVLNWVDDHAKEMENLLKSGQTKAALTILKDLRHRLLPQVRKNFLAPVLHTNACGDFTMLSRDDWFKIRGYPEWHVFSWAIDSIFLFQAYYNGLRSENLPADHTHYHIEHDYGSGWTPDGETTLWNRMDDRCVPYFSYEDTMMLIREQQETAENDGIILYNGLDWGFANENLPTQITAGAGMAKRSVKTVNQGKLSETFNPVAGLPRIKIDLAAHFTSNDSASVERKKYNGSDCLHLKTPGQAWTYGLGFNVKPELEKGGRWWIKARVKANKGRLSIGVLNKDQSSFLTKSGPILASQGERDVYLLIRDAEKMSCLIVRNTEKEEAGDLEIYSLYAYPMELADGSKPDQAVVEEIITEAAKRRMETVMPPMAPVEEESIQNEYVRLDLSSVFSANIATKFSFNEADNTVSVTTPYGIGAYAAYIEGDNENTSPEIFRNVHIHATCLSGAVTIALIDKENYIIRAESKLIDADNGDTAVKLIGRNFDHILVRNRVVGVSEVVIQSIEIEGREALDFNVLITQCARYAPHKDATVTPLGNADAFEVTTAPERFSYAVGYDLRQAFEGGGRRRVKVDITALSGCVKVGVLDESQTHWIALSEALTLEKGRQLISLEIDDVAAASVLMLHNNNNEPSRARVESVQVEGPARFMERIAQYASTVKVDRTMKLKSIVRKIWSNPLLTPIRQAAPAALRKRWRDFYQSRRNY